MATLRLQNGDFADAWRLVHSGGVKNQGRQSQRVAALLDELALTAAGWLFLFTALLAEAGAVESLSLKSRQTPADG